MNSKRFHVLMVGVDQKTKGGMWSVARSYIQSIRYQNKVDMKYVPVATVGSPIRKILFFAFGLIRILFLLLLKKWDLVHVHMAERGSVYRKTIIVLLAKCFGCKIVLHMHGAEFETWYNGLSEAKKAFAKKGLNSSDYILILGEYWRDFVSCLVEDPRKIRVLYNAIQIPATNQYSKTAKNMLFLGEIGQRKGVYDLLEAISLIDGRLESECKLLLYGTNPDKDIISRIEKKKLEHRVEYRGWVERTQFEQLFKGIAVNVLPSYHEGLPMSILETMAYGIPSITTRIAAIPEAVTQENGILLQAGDIDGIAEAIVRLLQEQETREAKSKNAYETVKKQFSFEHHLNELLKVYEEILLVREVE